MLIPARMYVVTFAGTITNAGGDFDLFSILPGTGRGIVLVSCEVTATSELAEAADEVFDISLKRGASTLGSGGSTPTPQPCDEGNGTATTCTVHTLDSTIASGGTEVEVGRKAPPQRNEYRYQPIPLEFITTNPGSVIALRLMNTVADDITARGELVFGELD